MVLCIEGALHYIWRREKKKKKYGKSHTRFRTIYSLWERHFELFYWHSLEKMVATFYGSLWGSQVYDIFDTFTAEQKGSEDDFDTAVKSLTIYFEPI